MQIPPIVIKISPKSLLSSYNNFSIRTFRSLTVTNKKIIAIFGTEFNLT